MKPKTMMLMVVAIGCGLGASYMTSRLLAERNNQTQAEATVKVLAGVAARPPPPPRTRGPQCRACGACVAPSISSARDG